MSLITLCLPGVLLVAVPPVVIYLAWQYSARQPRRTSGIRAVRWYPGYWRQRVYEFADYEPGWDGLMPGHEQHITGWHVGHNPRLWPWWESQTLPYSAGWKSYDDWRAGKPPEQP